MCTCLCCSVCHQYAIRMLTYVTSIYVYLFTLACAVYIMHNTSVDAGASLGASLRELAS